VPIGSSRLLGLAFASADLLIEISQAGEIALVLGASETLAGSVGEALTGQPWRSFVQDGDRPMVEALLDGLQPGERAGPIVIHLASPNGESRAAKLSAFTLPENLGAISCALSLANPDIGPPPGELHDRKSFEALATGLMDTAKNTGADLELALVELAGLSSVRDATPEAARLELETRIAGILRAQAHGGSAATELGDQRFALVRARGEAPETLAKRIGRLMDASFGQRIEATAESLPLSGEANSRQAARALRFTLDSFLREGVGEAPANLADALGQAMQRTMDEVGQLGAAIREKRFRLVYQPVVLIADKSIHHYETLVRFGDEQSPFPLIRMAEEMELIEPLDLAILERALETMGKDPGLKLAVNVSGRTIASAQFVEHACKMIGDYPRARGRLMFELTESAALDDLALADRHLQALREQGCEICLDDFGAGAASLAYLQQLKLDVLKIDGRYIRDLQHGGREATFVKHLVKMCRELGIRTLAEMVETEAAEDAVRRAGVDMAQGWLYGAAETQPKGRSNVTPIRAKIRPGLAR
jgi:EAL domain-containing protein (putative c-di-GMP-specific phosphodiesterase class I)